MTMAAAGCGDTRYAIYWAPEPHQLLAQIGAQWLAQDAGLAPVAEPALYGFHATLKPPFRLAEGYGEADLLAAVQALAQRHRAFEMPALRVAPLQAFLALRPAAPIVPTHPLWRLADACVSDLDLFRGPPSEAELSKRRAGGLDAEQDGLLQRWGYPHVLQRWRFHMTLTNALPELHQPLSAAPNLQAQLLEHLQALFTPALAQALRCDSICVFRQAGAGQAFQATHRFALADPSHPGLDPIHPLYPC